MIQCIADRESTEMYVKSKSRDTLRVIGERAHEFLESGEGSEFERILTMLMKVWLGGWVKGMSLMLTYPELQGFASLPTGRSGRAD